MNTNKMVRMFAATMLAGTSLSLSAATYTWVPGSTNWRSTASYKDESGQTPAAELPGSEDTVKFDGTQTVVITDADLPFVSALKCLSPLNDGVTLEFDLSGDGCLDADVYNTNVSGSFGKLVKKERGIYFGPASIVCLAGFFKALESGQIHNGETVLLNTGEGAARAQFFKDLIDK